MDPPPPIEPPPDVLLERLTQALAALEALRPATDTQTTHLHEFLRRMGLQGLPRDIGGWDEAAAQGHGRRNGF